MYHHLIPLGDNCELSFIVNELGYTGGSFFKWAACRIWAVHGVLERDFAGVFEFANLSPYSKNLILDRKYDIKFHTGMRSVVAEDGQRVFEQGLDIKALYRNEKEKRDYLIDKWNRIVNHPGERVLFLIKHHLGIEGKALVELYDMMAGKYSGRFDLLVVQHRDRPLDQGCFGDRRILLRYVDYFAPFDNATGYDRAGWSRIGMELLGRALPDEVTFAPDTPAW